MGFNAALLPAVTVRTLFCLILVFTFGVQPVCAAYTQALPGYKFEFPQDHASHDQFRTEWWYFSGHLKSKDSRTFGYELTFFRMGGDYEPANPASAWKNDNYNMAHFAITDESGKTFHFDEKVSRAKLDVAGARSDAFHVYNQGWSVTRLGEQFALSADTPDFSAHLLLNPLKPPVVHGLDGVVAKAAGPGCAMHCYSITRLKTDGLLLFGGKALEVSGTSWMDHEFGSYRLSPEQCGWDWYSIQLDDNRELMLYTIRRVDGTVEPVSSGTIIDTRGHAKHLTLEQFEITSLGTWHSEKSGGNYPMRWYVIVPGEKLEITLTPSVQEQELNTAAPTGITYWEGTVNIEGTSHGKAVSGQGYVEMTGYCEKSKENIF